MPQNTTMVGNNYNVFRVFCHVSRSEKLSHFNKISPLVEMTKAHFNKISPLVEMTAIFDGAKSRSFFILS